MKLRNKKTGEIKWFSLFDGKELEGGVTLKSLAEEWEDYEESKVYWIPMSDEPYPFVDNDWEKEGLATGLISLSKEENEIKREKLKAWKRLKEQGFRFNGWIREHKKGSADITIASFIDEDYDITDDIDLLFGGKE